MPVLELACLWYIHDCWFGSQGCSSECKKSWTGEGSLWLVFYCSSKDEPEGLGLLEEQEDVLVKIFKNQFLKVEVNCLSLSTTFLLLLLQVIVPFAAQANTTILESVTSTLILSL